MQVLPNAVTVSCSLPKLRALQLSYPQSQVLSLVKSSLLGKKVYAGQCIGSRIYGDILVAETKPQTDCVVSVDTSFCYFDETASNNSEEYPGLIQANECIDEFTKNLLDDMKKSLVGMEESLSGICHLFTQRVSMISKSCRPLALPAGLLLDGCGGSGKTTILRCIEAFLCSRRISVVYLDCCWLLFERFRGESSYKISEAMKSSAHLSSATGDPKFHCVLLDNMDLIFQNSETTYTSLSLQTTLLESIDFLRSRHEVKGFVVSTCTTVTSLPERFFLNCYFGKPYEIALPSKGNRQDIISKVFDAMPSSLNLSLLRTVKKKNSFKDLSTKHVFDMLTNEISSRTEGYSVLDVVSALKLGLEHVMSDENLSLDKILDTISAKKPSKAIDSKAATYIQDFVSSRPPPLPIGYEHIMKKIIRHAIPIENIPSSLLSLKQKLCISPSKGVIIYGPHGSGKTCLAHRIAYECRRVFKLVSLSCAELVNKIVGESEKQLAEVFRMARSIAPCFILLDNIDSILGTPSDHSFAGNLSSMPQRRSRTTHKAIDRILSTLLVEIDGVDSDSSDGKNIVILATASVTPKSLDKALIRPGRLEQHYCLDLPNEQQRTQIIKNLLGKEDLDMPSSDIESMVAASNNRTPAEIVQMVQEASITAIRQYISTESLINQDMSLAMKELRSLRGGILKKRFVTPEEQCVEY